MQRVLLCLVLSAASISSAQDTAHSAVLKARTLVEGGNWTEAERTLRSALGDGDDSAEIHGELGLILYHQGRFRDAVPELGRAAQLNPESAEYSLKLAASILGDHRYGVAVEFLQALAGRFGELAEYHY